MKQKFAEVVLRHLQKGNDFGCICGWNELGHNWADHLYEMLIRAQVLVDSEVEVQWGSRLPQSYKVIIWEDREHAVQMNQLTGHEVVFRLSVTGDWE